MTGGWRRPDVDRSRGCRTPDCPLGCWEVPPPAVYAHAAEVAEAWADDYYLRCDDVNMARAERSAAWLRERSEHALSIVPVDEPVDVQRVRTHAP